MSLLRTAVHGGLWTAGIRYGFFIINFVANLWLARLLTPKHFGIFALAMSTTELLFILAGFGIAMACINLHDEPDAFDTGMTLTAALAAGIFGLSLAVAFVIQRFYDGQIVLFMIVLCGMKSVFMLSTIYVAFLDVRHEFKTAAFIMGVGRPVAILVAVAMAYAGLEAWSLLGREILAMCLTIALAIALSPYRMRLRFNADVARRIWRFSVGVFFLRMTDTLYMRLPNVLLGSLAGLTVLGLYERSMYLSTMTNSILGQIYGKVGFTIFSKVKDQPDKIAHGLDWNVFFMSRVSFAVGASVFLFPELLLVGLLGQQWSEGWALFQGFSIMIALFPLIEVIKVGVMALGNTWLVTVSRFAAIGVTLFGVGIGWQTGRWEAAPWAMSVGALAMLTMLVTGGRRHGLHLEVVPAVVLPVLLSAVLVLAVEAVGWRETVPGLVVMLTAWGAVVLAVDGAKMLRFYLKVRAS